jgi:hypothetical protein
MYSIRRTGYAGAAEMYEQSNHRVLVAAALDYVLP